MTMSLQSTGFENGQPIPRKYTGEGEDVSPPLSWSGVPQATRELALVCDDPDAPMPVPYVHWLIYNLPPETTSLPEHLARTEKIDRPAGANQGCNSWTTDNVGYRGPMPPRGHGIHHYHFKLYALGTALNLPPSIDKDRLLAAMSGHVLETAELVGTYERK